MKGIIFTLDSIFALIIAVAAISMMAYFFYSPQTTSVLSSSSAESILQNLLSTNVESLASSNPIYSNLTYQANASGEVWDQYQRDQYRIGSNTHGPLSPSVSFLFNAGAQPTGISVDYGMIFFGAGSTLYALNATTGKLVWKKVTGSAIINQPIIYSGMLIYQNSTNMTAVNPITNSLIWSSFGTPTAGGNVNSQILAYNNKLYYGGSGNSANRIYSYYANNGTNAWNIAVASSTTNWAIDAGSLVIEYTGPKVLRVDQDFGASENGIYSSGGLPESISGLLTLPASNLIAFMDSAAGANALYINGTQASGFPHSLSYAATQPAQYNNLLYYQGSSSVTAIYSNGLQLWSATVPSAFGTAPAANSVVVASAKDIYTEWSNGYIAAMNSSSGNIAWYSAIPSILGTPSQQMSLGYGRLYVIAGNYIIAYGACSAPSKGSLLSYAATLYANGQGSCADAIINNVYSMTNYSIFLNNTFAPGISAASFNGIMGSMIQTGSPITFDRSNPISISFWLKTSTTGQDGFLIMDADGLGAVSAGFTAWLWHGSNVISWRFEDTSANVYTVGGTTNVEDGKWHFITVTYDGLGDQHGMRVYVDGKLDGTGTSSVITSSINPSPTQYNAEIAIGAASLTGYYPYTGYLSNIQIYNTSLSGLQIGQLYQGGIQTGPLKNAGLYGWYPLAGDANDYSGFGVTGYSTNVLYLSSNYLPNGYKNSFQVSSAGITLPIQNYTTGLNKLYKVSVVSWR